MCVSFDVHSHFLANNYDSSVIDYSLKTFTAHKEPVLIYKETQNSIPYYSKKYNTIPYCITNSVTNNLCRSYFNKLL